MNAPAPAPAPVAANNPPPPPPPPPTWYDLALLPGANGVATNRADPARGYIQVFGQNTTVQSYPVKLSAKFGKKSLVRYYMYLLQLRLTT
jgi:hypothetical protein